MSPSGWTVDTLKEHVDALRAADQRALQIKETADGEALDLARQIQTYKDEAANELRSQINSERGIYATHDDLASAVEKIELVLAPVLAYVNSRQGRSGGLNDGWKYLLGVIGLIPIVATIFLLLHH